MGSVPFVICLGLEPTSEDIRYSWGIPEEFEEYNIDLQFSSTS